MDSTTPTAEPLAPALAPISSVQPDPTPKPIHSLVLDTGPLIRNEISPSTLLSKAVALYTIPAVIPEIRDEATRSRFQTTIAPFLTIRNPRPESIQHVSAFARRTGDLEVLSRPDLLLLALTYELECERNGGDWRLRRDPTQKGLNGKPVEKKDEAKDAEGQAPEDAPTTTSAEKENDKVEDSPREVVETADTTEATKATEDEDSTPEISEEIGSVPSTTDSVPPTEQLANLNLTSPADGNQLSEVEKKEEEGGEEEVESVEAEDLPSDDGEGEWITPSNIKKQKEKENTSSLPIHAQRTLEAALLTSDNAMRNVALRMNLNLLDSSMSQVTRLKQWVLRCHGCYAICKNMEKQFCPRCGQPTLTRVSCSTDASGNFQVHLKKNYQWNNRGNVYSIPKPVHGSANGKTSNVKGGGKHGWGQGLILAEDQKEYAKKADENRRTRYRDLMDEDYLPGILTGDRQGNHGRVKVGAGRNINSKKR